MKLSKGKLKLNVDVIVPQDEALLNKYYLGAQLLLNYKNALIVDNDETYNQFLEIYTQLSGKTLLDFDRMFILYQTVLATNHLKGCSAECGVYKGGGSILIAMSNNNRRHYALDSFEGLPETGSNIDIHKTGDFSDISFAEVQLTVSEYENIFLLKGFFAETFPIIDQKEFSFVYIDADLYQSTLECCYFFYPRIVQGGMILFDDYLIQSTPGVKKAVDEFFSNKIEFPIIVPTCQPLVVKL